jgi:hypothetical protein
MNAYSKQPLAVLSSQPPLSSSSCTVAVLQHKHASCSAERPCASNASMLTPLDSTSGIQSVCWCITAVCSSVYLIACTRVDHITRRSGAIIS